MSLSQRKVNTTAFTNALKQVFHIHKNVVAELCAKLDIISDECKLLKTNSHIPSSFGRCESCVHLTKMNGSLQEHFNRLLHEKDKDMKALEAKLQALTGESNIGFDQTLVKQDRILPKEISCVLVKEGAVSVKDQECSSKNSGIKQHPFTKYNDVDAQPLEIRKQEDIRKLTETELCKGHSRLRLTRQSKRHCSYLEEQQERKRVKISPLTSEREKSASFKKSESKESDATGCHTLLVPDTDCTTLQGNSNEPTLQFNCSEKNKNDETESDDNQSQQILVVPETIALDNSSNSDDDENGVEFANNFADNDSQKELISRKDRNYNHESVFNDISGKNDKGNVHILTVNNFVPVLKESLHDGSNIDVEDETVCLGKRQSESEKKFKYDAEMELLLQNENMSKCHGQSSGDKKNDCREVVQRKGAFQNSLNVMEMADISKISETMTEKQMQTLGALDETIAPNLISQYMLQQNPDSLLSTRSNALEKLGNQTSQTGISTEKSEAPHKLDTSTKKSNDFSPQITVTRTPRKRLNMIYRESMNESRLQARDEWCEDDDSDDPGGDSVFISMEDDPETIEPSPQQSFQNGSQISGSIPSTSCSFNFIHKRSLLTRKSVMQEAGSTSKKMPIVDKKIDDKRENMDVDGNLFNDKRGPDHSTVQDIQDPSIQSFLDSFDRVPKLEEPAFPHVSVVRKRSERNKLEGFSCSQCYEYYKNSGLSEDALQQKKNECSRHRERYRAPETPEHFWSLGFPDTAEMIERRQKYGHNESPVNTNRAPRRRRRLEKKF